VREKESNSDDAQQQQWHHGKSLEREAKQFVSIQGRWGCRVWRMIAAFSD
jgi:hypothetical protein